MVSVDCASTATVRVFTTPWEGILPCTKICPCHVGAELFLLTSAARVRLRATML